MNFQILCIKITIKIERRIKNKIDLKKIILNHITVNQKKIMHYNKCKKIISHLSRVKTGDKSVEQEESILKNTISSCSTDF